MSDDVAELGEKLIEATENLEITGEVAKKKKNKKKKKKENEAPAPSTEEIETKVEDVEATCDAAEGAAEKSAAKKKKNKKKKAGKTQTDPPSLPIVDLFPNGNFPEGQIMEHPIANNDQKVCYGRQQEKFFAQTNPKNSNKNSSVRFLMRHFHTFLFPRQRKGLAVRRPEQSIVYN